MGIENLIIGALEVSIFYHRSAFVKFSVYYMPLELNNLFLLVPLAFIFHCDLVFSFTLILNL